jgi:ribosome biogenesis GTPase
VPSGLIVAAVGRHVTPETEAGQRLQAHARGKRSEAVVGDRVQWNTTQAGGETQAVIEAIEDRRNLMHRQDLMRTKSFAANLDQVLMLVSSQPLFSESQLTRALVAADAADIPLHIVLNKTDLPDAALARERLQPYVAMGTSLVETSVKHRPEQSRERLAALLAGRTTLLLGASGTGKSSMVNLLVPQAQSRVGELSQALQAGRHTTTHTLWHWLDPSRHGALIDSPGFQEFGLQQIGAAELAHHMADFRPLLGQCRFSNCQHRHEPDCAITAAVAQGAVSATRYRIYLEILDELQTRRW